MQNKLMHKYYELFPYVVKSEEKRKRKPKYSLYYLYAL